VSSRRLLVLLVPICLMASPAVASAQQRTVTAIGSGSARVRPADRHDNKSIRRAVEAAVRRALPRAIADAKRDATRLATDYGLALGDVLSVAETPPSPFGAYGIGETEGAFGPGRYCGRIRTSVIRHVNGHRRRVIRSRRICSFPHEVASSITVTYAATPAAQ
jgi:hypothetical protein